jgi:hypothetical protein
MSRKKSTYGSSNLSYADGSYVSQSCSSIGSSKTGSEVLIEIDFSFRRRLNLLPIFLNIFIGV